MGDEIVVASVILPSGGAAWDGYGAIRVTFGRDRCSGEPGVQIEQEGGGVPVVLAAMQARSLARALDAAATRRRKRVERGQVEMGVTGDA